MGGPPGDAAGPIERASPEEPAPSDGAPGSDDQVPQETAAGAAESNTDTSGEPPQHPRIGHDLRRRLDDVFGDVLPTVTSDERDMGERSGLDAEFYRANRPPHHDR